jgi:hypothetical protein
VEHPRSHPVFSGVRGARSLVFCVVFCRSLFVILSFFFWSLCCLFFFDLRILIIPLVSSNSSCKTVFFKKGTSLDFTTVVGRAYHALMSWLFKVYFAGFFKMFPPPFFLKSKWFCTFEIIPYWRNLPKMLLFQIGFN